MVKSKKDPAEDYFELHGRLWEDYLEWCDSGYVVRGTNGQPVALSTTPSPKDFEIWKQQMGYYDDLVEDK